MRQVLGPGTLGRPRGIGWRGRWKGGSGWGMHVIPWLIHVNVWQYPLQYCKVISLQLVNEKKKRKCNQKNVWGPAARHSKANKQPRLVERKVCFISGASVAQSVKNLPAMQETQVRFLGWEDPLEKEMATHSNILAWPIPWTEEPGRLQSTGSQELDTT